MTIGTGQIGTPLSQLGRLSLGTPAVYSVAVAYPRVDHTVSDHALFTHSVSSRLLVTHTISDREPVLA